MWSFVEGVKRPDPLKPKPPSKKTKVEKKKDYDSDRKFKSQWRYTKDGTERFWLVYNESTGLIGCSVCKDHAQGKASESNFVRCIAECKKDTITKHEKTKLHEKSILIHRAKQNPEKTEGMFKLSFCVSFIVHIVAI